MVLSYLTVTMEHKLCRVTITKNAAHWNFSAGHKAHLLTYFRQF